MKKSKVVAMDKLKQALGNIEEARVELQKFAWKWFLSPSCICNNKQEILKCLDAITFEPILMRKVIDFCPVNNNEYAEFLSFIEFEDKFGSVVRFLHDVCLEVQCAIDFAEKEMVEKKVKQNSYGFFVLDNFKFAKIHLPYDNPLGADWMHPNFNLFVEHKIYNEKNI